MEPPRHAVISDTFHHWVHHPGQMTVYPLLGSNVPALFGPPADDRDFR